jgi:hypothetical protein
MNKAWGECAVCPFSSTSFYVLATLVLPFPFGTIVSYIFYPWRKNSRTVESASRLALRCRSLGSKKEIRRRILLCLVARGPWTQHCLQQPLGQRSCERRSCGKTELGQSQLLQRLPTSASACWVNLIVGSCSSRVILSSCLTWNWYRTFSILLKTDHLTKKLHIPSGVAAVLLRCATRSWNVFRWGGFLTKWKETALRRLCAVQLVVQQQRCVSGV